MESPGPGGWAAWGPETALVVTVMVMVMVVVVMPRGGERRASKDHQKQCGSKNFLHAKMLHDEGPALEAKWRESKQERVRPQLRAK
jgi:hypothetical protein